MVLPKEQIQLIDNQVAELEKEKRELMVPGSPYWSSQHPEHETYVQRVLELNEQLYPEPEG